MIVAEFSVSFQMRDRFVIRHVIVIILAVRDLGELRGGLVVSVAIVAVISVFIVIAVRNILPFIVVVIEIQMNRLEISIRITGVIGPISRRVLGVDRKIHEIAQMLLIAVMVELIQNLKFQI